MALDINQLKELVRSDAVQRYLDEPNITSVGIGYKVDGETQTDEVAVQFTVERKVVPEMLDALGTPMIPEAFTFDGETIPTDVVERTFAPTFEIIAERLPDFRKVRQATVTPGISVSNALGTAGTFGCVVYDAETGHPYILSNWHVLHGSQGQIGDNIVQPGPFDDNSGVEVNRIGHLVRSHLGLAGDCAVATIEGREFDARIFELDIAPQQLARVSLGTRVVKSGRTTGVTHGIVTRVFVTTNINYGGATGVKRIGGFEIGPDPDLPADKNEISMGGDSGSLWLIKDSDTDDTTDIAAGLHFAGEAASTADEYALACNLDSVLRKLNVTLSLASRPIVARVDRFRGGFDPGFLGLALPLPELTGRAKRSALTLDGSAEIKYTHFSLAMYRERRMALFTAHNIDGQRMKLVPRSGTDWRFDTRFPSEQQAGNDVYQNNPWDRGHLVRRAAVLWGTLDEARRANADSFHYTNAVPQHRNFNRDEWVHLEDWVLGHASDDFYRLSVFTGPVFTANDERYRSIQIPAAFWKIIAVRKGPQAELSVVAFLMNQYELLADHNGRRFLNLTLYQVAVEVVESLTDLRFEPLKPAQPEAILETLTVPEGAEPEPWRIIGGPDDLVL